jgi:predicted nucleic acid-binding protein
MASPPTGKATSTLVDSSVLIAAAISARGAARDLLLEGLRGRRTLHLSTLVLLETERNLRKKQPAALPAFEGFRAALTAAVVDPPVALVRRVAGVVAPKDAPIVAAALEAGAAYLASYDRKHLLRQREAIKAEFGLIVATPDEILSAAP